MSTREILGRTLQRRNRKFLRDNPLCVFCSKEGKVRQAAEVDHIIPLHQDGPDEVSNLQGLCRPCHVMKSARERGFQGKQTLDADGWPVDSKDMLRLVKEEKRKMRRLLSPHSYRRNGKNKITALDFVSMVESLDTRLLLSRREMKKKFGEMKSA
jgi:5-methylcytosine-specific restriction protein A